MPPGTDPGPRPPKPQFRPTSVSAACQTSGTDEGLLKSVRLKTPPPPVHPSPVHGGSCRTPSSTATSRPRNATPYARIGATPASRGPCSYFLSRICASAACAKTDRPSGHSRPADLISESAGTEASDSSVPQSQRGRRHLTPPGIPRRHSPEPARRSQWGRRHLTHSLPGVASGISPCQEDGSLDTRSGKHARASLSRAERAGVSSGCPAPPLVRTRRPP